jgi:aldehyde:ferredoxin oxidoreductase
MYGYAGKILDVDLSLGTIKQYPLNEELLTDYISGMGINAKILYDQLEPGIDALSPGNILVFSVGVLAGTNIPTACRVEASAKSPLTGLTGTSNSGNYWGSELKYAGFDSIILRGRADKPVMLVIRNGVVELQSAEHLWGKDSWETIGLIRTQFNEPEMQIATIGQGGENLVRFASIENGYYDAWGRTGLGAVMGSKNLKAIALRGTGSIKVADKSRFLKAVDKTRQAIYNSPFYAPFSKFGTMLATVPYHEFGALPGRNFQQGTVDNWLDTRSRKVVPKYSSRGVACISCPIACAHWSEVKDGPYKGLKMKDMEVTPVIGFGAACDIPDMNAIIKATEVCQRYGVDLVSASSTVAFAMELYQRGIITKEQLGFELNWGDAEAAFRLLEQVVYRRGVGDLLAEGTKRAGVAIRGAEKYAIHVKGLEIPMADARGRWSTWTFGNITNVRGGDHLRNRNPAENLRFNDNPIPYRTEKFGFPDQMYANLDMPEEVKEQVFDPETRDVNIPAMSKWAEDLIALYNILGLCIRPPVLQTVGPTLLAELYSSLTGREITPEQLIRVGERSWTLQKLFNLREGEKPEDSRYPDRFYEQPLPSEGSSNGRKLDQEAVKETLAEYYAVRGWDPKTGSPGQEKLSQLGLEKKI